MRNRKFILSFYLILLAMLVTASLVLRFAAPNPTHRWYSTEVLDTSSSTSPEKKGIQGEYLLAHDLGLDAPTNERSSNAVCVCGTRYTISVPTQCGQCAVYTADISNYRIPDFVTNSYIAEAKNRFSIAASDADTLAQITEMVAAARALHIPFYLFVRVNTAVDKVYYDLARSTGGDVIQYFLVDGYQNWLIAEQAINNILFVLIILTSAVLVLGYIINNRPKSPSDVSDDVDRAEDIVEETEEFMKRMERLSKRSKDDDKKGKL